MMSESARALGPQFDPQRFAKADAEQAEPPPRTLSRRRVLVWTGAGGAFAAAAVALGISMPAAGAIRTGLGEENAELYDALTRDGGGVFQCFTEADVKVVARAHKSQCLLIEKVRFEGASALNEVLVAGRRSAVTGLYDDRKNP